MEIYCLVNTGPTHSFWIYNIDEYSVNARVRCTLNRIKIQYFMETPKLSIRHSLFLDLVHRYFLHLWYLLHTKLTKE